MLQWVGLLLVRVQFPHIALFPQIRNKKPFVCKKIDKSLKFIVPKLTLKVMLSHISKKSTILAM
jgi:hypothetical protein